MEREGTTEIQVERIDAGLDLLCKFSERVQQA